MTDDLAALARAILDASLYMTLGTADESGRPWVSPVYYAADGYQDVSGCRRRRRGIRRTSWHALT
jgi:hypothetical protein